MSHAADQELSWHLGSVPSTRPASANWKVNIRERISNEEYESHQSYAGLLAETLSGSSFAALQKGYCEFKDIIEHVVEAFDNKQLTPDMIQTIGTKIDDILTSLRRFADRTGHALSQRYGKESQEYKTFTQALSFEFDNAFPYRFAWHLRNYSDHRGSVSFRIKQESRLGASGKIEQALQVAVDSGTLLRRYEWHTLVRHDLESINGEFSIEAVIDGVQMSCKRAYCKTLLAQEESIVAALEYIRALARRADPPVGFGPCLINAPLCGGVSPITVSISSISIELADVAETALQQARVMAA